MTSPSIIGDDEAKRIAMARQPDPEFVETGAITAGFLRWAKSAHAYASAYRGEVGNPLYALAAYVAHHGERSAQSGWSEL